MALYVNGTKIGTELGNLVYNNINITEVRCNGVIVWQRLVPWDVLAVNDNSVHINIRASSGTTWLTRVTIYRNQFMANFNVVEVRVLTGWWGSPATYRLANSPVSGVQIHNGLNWSTSDSSRQYRYVNTNTGEATPWKQAGGTMSFW